MKSDLRSKYVTKISIKHDVVNTLFSLYPGQFYYEFSYLDLINKS